MANQIILKRSATPGKVPTAGQLALGEIAINTHDGLIYIKRDNGTPSVVQIGGVTSVNGETGAVTIDTGDVAENGNLYFTNARARSALNAGSGISYNSSTGAISTAQNLTTAGSPTFAGLTLTGNVGITGNIIPSASNVYSLGSAEMPFKDVFVGPGSLYVNGVEVIHSLDETMNFTADIDQNMRITTTGTGILQFGSNTTVVQMAGTLQITNGKNITDSAGTSVGFGNAINMNSNKIVSVGAPSASTDAATKGYVDTQVASISTSSITQGNSSVQVIDSGTGTVTVTVDGTTALTVDATGVVVTGGLTVNGTTTTVNSNTIKLADNIITLNSDADGAPTQNAGLEVERGDEANVQVRWNEGSDKWTFSNDGAVYYPIAVTTTDLAEGTNLYFTDTRARSSLSASTATGISYNSSTGLFNLGSIPNSALSNNSITINGVSTALGATRTLDTDSIGEGTNNKYFSNTLARGAVSAAGSLSYNSTTGVFSYTTPSTSGITEGTNLYFTDARARGAVSAGTGISYNSTTGVITNTITQYTDALARAAVSAGSGISYNSATGVFTSDTSVMATKSYVDGVVAGKDNTDEITEGTTNLYFTNARARGAVSAGTGISYNSTTGVITNTITQYTDALAVSANTSAIATAKSEAISAAASDATAKVAAETTARNAAIAAAVALKDNTDEITEGTTNLYFTNARARGAVSASGDLSYNNTTGVISFTQNKAWSALTGTPTTIAGYGITNAYTKTEVDTAITTAVAGKDNTDEITEGSSNLYFTTARARGAVSAGTGISYNSSTGVITNTITQYTDALARGAVSFAAGSGAYNSTTGVITIPTNTSQLTNGASFITLGSLSAGTGISYNNVSGVISANAIPNASLANSSVTVGTTAIALGASSTTLAGLTSVTSTGFTGALTGNASTATTLQTARAIQGVNFDGSAAITVVTAGTGVSVSGTQVSIGQAVGTGNSPTFAGLTVSGDLTVNGTTTTINSTTISVDDKNIELGSVATPTNLTADGGGITLKGSTDKTFNWVNATSAWTSSEHMALAGGKNVLLNGSTSGTVTVSVPAVAGTTTITLPATTGTVVTTGDTGSVTNTMLAGSIANAKLANSSTTIGTTAIALGASSTTLAGLTSVTSSSFVGALTGNASTATTAAALTNARTISLTGDVTGSVSFDGSANAAITATIAANSVALGTDTTGNYMVNVTAGTGISVSHTQGEGSTATITNSDLGSSQNIFKNFTDGTTTAAADSNNDTFKFRGSNGVTVAVASDDATHGDSLLVSLSSVPNSSLANSAITVTAGTGMSGGGSVSLGGSVTLNSTITQYTDAMARAAVSAGTGISYNSTTGVITNTITQYTDALAVSANTSAIATAKSEAISAAASDATTKANAAQAAAIAAVTNGAGAAFDTLKEIQDAMATDAELSAAISALTIGNGTQTVTAGSYLTGGGSFTANQTGSSSVTLNVDATNLNTASKVVARDASGNFSAGTITATLSGQASTVASISGNTLTSSQITTGLGFTPYNSTNPNGYTTNTGTVTSVTATGPVVSSGGTAPVISMPAATASVAGHMTTAYASKLDGIAAGATNVTNTNQLTNGAGYVTTAGARSAVSFTAGSGAYNSSTGVFTIPTNTNQLTNGAGFITGYTETDTLSSVTGRGASTGSAITISNSTASSSKTTGALIVTGGVGISGALFVGGEVTAYASDAALKTNVVAIGDALSKVEAIRGVSYDWNEAGVALGLGTDKQIGVIAQEVEAVLPELVVDSAHEGYKTVKYDKLTALLIEAVKELSAEVKTLKAQLGNK